MDWVSLESHQAIQWRISWQQLLSICVMAVLSFMVALDATIIVTALPHIVESIEATSIQAFWIGTAYLLSNAAFQLPVASLSDFIGRWQAVMASLVCFIIGSVTAAAAHSMTTMLVGRTIQGVGGGGLTAMALVNIADLVPLESRPRYLAINLAAWAAGTILGPVSGGAISQASSWRWVFWIMLPFCGLGLVLVPFTVQSRSRKTSLAAVFVQFDWIGTLTFLVSLAAFLVAVSWGGLQFKWSAAATLVPLTCGLCGIFFVIIWESYFAPNPFLRRCLFHTRGAALTFAMTIIHGILLYGGLYSLPLYFLTVKHTSSKQAGVNLLPTLVACIPASVLVAVLISGTDRFRWTTWLGWVLVTLGTGLGSMWNQHTTVVIWTVTEIIAGFGHGCLIPSLSISGQAYNRKEDAASAASMYSFLRQLGAAIGIPIATNVFQAFGQSKLKSEGLDPKIITNGLFNPGFAGSASNNKGIDGALTDGYVAGLQGTFRILTATAGVGLLLSLFVPHRKCVER